MMLPREQEEEAGAIRLRLETPSEAVSLSELSERFFGVDIRLRLAGAAAAVAEPGLAGRIRGAFGVTLARAASPEARGGHACTWYPPCAFDVLFRKQGRIEAGLDFPAPWVVLLDPAGRDLVVTLRIFGFACDYAGAAAEALTDAVANHLELGRRPDQFLPRCEIIRRTLRPMERPRAFKSDQAIQLNFLSPVVLSSSSALERPASLITGAAARAAGLARWHDCALELDRGALKEAVAALDLNWRDICRHKWSRGSRRQDRSIPMEGYTGVLEIEGATSAIREVAVLLSLGELMFVGADVAFGCGRYMLDQTGLLEPLRNP